MSLYQSHIMYIIYLCLDKLPLSGSLDPINNSWTWNDSKPPSSPTVICLEKQEYPLNKDKAAGRHWHECSQKQVRM